MLDASSVVLVFLMACSDKSAHETAAPAPDTSDSGLAPGADDTAPTDDTSPSDDTVVIRETGETAETGDSGDSGDSGDGGDAVGAPATLTADGPVSCLDPTLRTTEGPFYLANGGVSWSEEQLRLTPVGDDPRDRGVTVADFTGDGLLDIFLANVGQDQLYVGLPGGLWVDETGARWTTEARPTVAAPAVDVDDDGDLDIYTVNRGGEDVLMLNDGAGYFSPALTQPTPGDANTCAAFGDMDGDGDLDLFTGGHQILGADPIDGAWFGPAADAGLFENDGGVFTDRSERLPQAAHDGYTFAAGWHDVDGDGDTDLYVVNDYGALVQPNVLLRQGDGELLDASVEAGLSLNARGMGLGAGDLNDDGLPDLLISDWDSLWLMESLPDGTFYNSALARGLAPVGDQHVAWGAELVDVDNDGLLDAAVSYGFLNAPAEDDFGNADAQPDALYLQQEDGTFDDRALSYGLADDRINRGFAVADLNDDGWPDLVKVALDGPAHIMLSRCGEAAWLWVTLDQPGRNRDAVGARIEVESGGRVWRRWITGPNTNYGAAGPLEAHFGLGELDRIDAITVSWPDGERSRFEDVETRQRLRVTRVSE